MDVSYQYMLFFVENDEEMEETKRAYKAGELLTGELKQRCIKVLQEFVQEFQEKRKQVTDDIVKEFMDSARPLVWRQGKAEKREVEVRS